MPRVCQEGSSSGVRRAQVHRCGAHAVRDLAHAADSALTPFPENVPQEVVPGIGWGPLGATPHRSHPKPWTP